MRTAVVLSRAVVELIRDPGRDPETFERLFARSRDPWGYARREEQDRHGAALALLDSLRRGRRFARAVEIGCAEGIFTEQLAPRCDFLLALDFAQLAIARTRARLAGHVGVEVMRWDLREQSLDGQFDLIVAMDVLSTVLRPAQLLAAIDKLVQALRPGGHLLVTDVRQSTKFETTWWGKYLRRGGVQILDTLTDDRRLRLLHRDRSSSHVFALFER